MRGARQLRRLQDRAPGRSGEGGSVRHPQPGTVSDRTAAFAFKVTPVFPLRWLMSVFKGSLFKETKPNAGKERSQAVLGRSGHTDGWEKNLQPSPQLLGARVFRGRVTSCLLGRAGGKANLSEVHWDPQSTLPATRCPAACSAPQPAPSPRSLAPCSVLPLGHAAAQPRPLPSHHASAKGQAQTLLSCSLCKVFRHLRDKTNSSIETP